MWTQIQPGRWSRDEGFLLADGDLMLELHGNTLHTYRKDPAADPRTNTGGPLDGYTHQSTEPVREVGSSAPAVDAPTAWRVLVARAAQVDAARTVNDSRTPPPPISRQGR